MESLAPILQRELLFPYLDGQGFVEHIHAGGGWAAVDAAWLDPPRSTEQVMHPERYPDDLPVALELPDVAALLGPGWTAGYVTTMGELRIGVFVADDEPFTMADLVLGAKLPSAAAADGWGGDRIVTADGPDGAWTVAWQTAWDTSEDAAEFATAAREAMADLPGAHVVLGVCDSPSAAQTRAPTSSGCFSSSQTARRRWPISRRRWASVAREPVRARRREAELRGDRRLPVVEGQERRRSGHAKGRSEVDGVQGPDPVLATDVRSDPEAFGVHGHDEDAVPVEVQSTLKLASRWPAFVSAAQGD